MIVVGHTLFFYHTMQRYASMVCAAIMCLCVRMCICHMPVLYQSGHHTNSVVK